MTTVVNFSEKFKLFGDTWAPKVVGTMNDYDLKLVRLLGEFVFHKHDDTDETFVILEGCLDIELEDGMIHLNEGEMVIIPAGVLHRPIANSLCKALLLEAKGTVNTGSILNELTAPAREFI